MKAINKIKILLLWLYLRHNVTIYFAKSHLITSLSSLIFHFPSWYKQCVLILFTPLRHLLYLRVHMLFIEPSSVLFGILFIRFSRIFTVPLTPPVSITIAAPLSLIFFTSHYNFGSFVSSLPDSLPFLPVLFLIFFFSLTLYLYSSVIFLSLFHSLLFSSSWRIPC